MNSVSTVTKVSLCRRWQRASSAAVVVINSGGGKSEWVDRAMRRFYTASWQRPKPQPALKGPRCSRYTAGERHDSGEAGIEDRQGARRIWRRCCGPVGGPWLGISNTTVAGNDDSG